MRKRATKQSSPQHQQVADEFLDEDEQEELVQSLEQEAKQQTRFFQQVFSIICWGAMVLALVVPTLVLGEYNLAFAIHSGVASSLHWIAQARATGKAIPLLPTTTSLGVLMGTSLLPLLVVITVMSSKHHQHVDLHVGLALSNMLTMGFSCLLCADATFTESAIQSLRSSKYKHKSI